MNKFFSIIIPYMIVLNISFVHIFDIQESMIINSVVLAVLSSFWFMAIYKTEGTKLVKCLTIFNIVIFLFMMIFGLLNSKIEWLYDVVPTLIYLVMIECFGFYILCQNKPRYTMTYKFSFRNKRRRYF